MTQLEVELVDTLILKWIDWYREVNGGDIGAAEVIRKDIDRIKTELVEGQ